VRRVRVSVFGEEPLGFVERSEEYHEVEDLVVCHGGVEAFGHDGGWRGCHGEDVGSRDVALFCSACFQEDAFGGFAVDDADV